MESKSGKKIFWSGVGIGLGVLGILYFFPPKKVIEYGKDNILYEKYNEMKNKQNLAKKTNKRLEFYRKVLYEFDIDLRTFYNKDSKNVKLIESIYEQQLSKKLVVGVKKNRLDYYLEEQAYENLQHLVNIYEDEKYQETFGKDFDELDAYFTKYTDIIMNGDDINKFREIDHKINYLLYDNVEKFSYYEILYKAKIRSDLLLKAYNLQLKLEEKITRESLKLLLSRFMTLTESEKKESNDFLMEQINKSFSSDTFHNIQDVAFFYKYLKESQSPHFMEYSTLLKENVREKIEEGRGNYDGGYFRMFKLFCVEDPDFGKEIVESQIEKNFANSYFVSAIINSYVETLLLRNEAEKGLELYENYPFLNEYHAIDEFKKLEEKLIDHEVIYHAEFILKYTKMLIYDAIEDMDNSKKMLQEEFRSMKHLYNMELKDSYGYDVYTDDAHVSKMKDALRLYIQSSLFTNNELLACIKEYEDFFEYDIVMEHEIELDKTVEEYAQFQLRLHTLVYSTLKNRNMRVPKKLYHQTRKLVNHYSFREKYTSLSSEVNILYSLHQSVKK